MVTREMIEKKAKHHREQQETFAMQAAQHRKEAERLAQLSIVHQGAAEMAEDLLSEFNEPKTE